MYPINLVIVLNYFIASSDTNDLRRKKASEKPKAALHGPQRARLAKRRVRHRKILKEKIEIGPTYAPHRKGSVTATKQQKEKIFRKRSVGKPRRGRDRQEELPETKRREDPPRTRPSRRTSGNEASGDPPKTNRGTHTARRQIHALRRRQVQTRKTSKPRFGPSKQR